MKKDYQSKSPKIKKELGQHFLCDFSIAEKMIQAVDAKGKTVFEIGCGDGFLTNAILNLSRCKKLVTVEIDQTWADLVRDKIKDVRFNLINQDILEFDFKEILDQTPLVLLANLPYNITIQIFQVLIKNKALFSEGAFMVQEEVAQKLVATGGKARGALTLFMQNHFDLKLLDKVPPTAFRPPPKVVSRNVYFRPKASIIDPLEEEQFWLFVRKCFAHPRQTVRNNLKQMNLGSILLNDVDEVSLNLRPQHLPLEFFKNLWQILKKS